MSVRGRLRINLTDESRAYGYTLVIWGTGAILIDVFGFPNTAEVIAYISGAVLGFSILALVIYGNVFRQVENIKDEALVIASSIHFIAALGTIGLAAAFVERFPPLWSFLLAGVNATVTYNILLLVESIFSRRIATRSWSRSTQPDL